MKRLTIWFIIISTLAFTGMKCEKESLKEDDCNGNCYIIQGKVTDSITLQGIPNVIVSIFKDARPFIVYTVVKGSTNTRGEYKLIFDGKLSSRNDSYYLAISHQDYKYDPLSLESTEDVYLNLQQAQYDVPVVRNLSLLKPGTIKLHVTSDNVVNFDTFTFDYDYGRDLVRKLIKGQKKIDTTFLLTTASGIKTNIKWSKNTLAAFGPANFDTVTVSGTDTLNYNLKVD